MIASRIHPHVDLRRHVAIYAGTAAATGRVTMVGNRIVGLGFVALGADAIALCNELIAMWVVAVATYDARLRHFALHK